MNPKNAPKQPAVHIRTRRSGPAPKTMTVVGRPNAHSGFSKFLKAIARGEITEWVEVKATRLERKGADAKHWNQSRNDHTSERSPS